MKPVITQTGTTQANWKQKAEAEGPSQKSVVIATFNSTKDNGTPQSMGRESSEEKYG